MSCCAGSATSGRKTRSEACRRPFSASCRVPAPVKHCRSRRLGHGRPSSPERVSSAIGTGSRIRSSSWPMVSNGAASATDHCRWSHARSPARIGRDRASSVSGHGRHMARAVGVDHARKAFADMTATLEDAALVASEGQAAPDLERARRTCDRLIAELEACLKRLQRLRRRLG